MTENEYIIHASNAIRVVTIVLMFKPSHNVIINTRRRYMPCNNSLNACIDLYLLVHRGIPITVVEDDGVSCCQINAEPSRTCAQQKHKDLVADEVYALVK